MSETDGRDGPGGRLDLATATRLIDGAREATSAGAPLAIDVVDAHGHRVVFTRMDDAMLAASHTIPARTALLLARRTTPFVRDAERDPCVALSLCAVAGMVVSAGAVPLQAGTAPAGAIGSSGGRAAEDEHASEAGARLWADRQGSG